MERHKKGKRLSMSSADEAVMSTTSEQLGRSEQAEKEAVVSSSAFELEDPFDDPALVTNAFLDIMWQDGHGNSALMLAAAENRILHVKGILTMAAERGTLWQVLNMRNEDGMSALEMALGSGSDTCAMLITRFAKEYQKQRPRLRGMSFSQRAGNVASETDIMIEFDDAPSPAVPFASRRPFVLEPAPRRLSRDKIANNLKRVPPADYVLKMNRNGRPPQHKLLVQRTMSGDSLTSLPSPSSSVSTPTDTMKPISVGDKLRSIFSSKKPTNRETSAALRPQEYKKSDEENRLLDTTTMDSAAPSNNSSEQKFSAEEVFRSPWPPGRPTRLPPLANLRRRTASETRTKAGGQEL